MYNDFNKLYQTNRKFYIKAYIFGIIFYAVFLIIKFWLTARTYSNYTNSRIKIPILD